VTRQSGSWDDEVQRARFATKLQSLQFRIVLLDNQPVGAVSSTEHDDHILLNELLILPEFQNRGIGSRVLVGEVQHANLLGKPMRLHPLRLNLGAGTLWEARGIYGTHLRDGGRIYGTLLLKRLCGSVRPPCPVNRGWIRPERSTT
jgi:GNAT superfamily N-acetyltransferase